MFGFSDETYIDIASGNGGNGCVSFRREKFVEKGGPDGGDGGKGGDLVFVVKDNLRTLAHLKIIRTFRAENGKNGSGARCYGRAGNDMEIPVPPGTVIKDANTGEIIKDLTGVDRFVFLKGGRGGLGNYHFRTSTRQAPKFAQPGEPGIEMRVGLELLVIADIGFVGFPNAGKSSLMNMLTNARSKVASYPFTTKIPQLGMMRLGDQDVVLADIPGIIEGASQGAGMGFKFLKHIARTGGLAYLVDMSEPDCLDKYELLRHELETYSPDLVQKKEVLIGTKLDEDGAQENFERFKAKFSDKTVFGMSIFDEDSVKPIMKAFVDMLGKNTEEKGFSSRPDTDAYYPETQEEYELR
ncbi:MAG: GTPase ObgE [Spirochaetales bacterium]|jgi:GTP-binding protein|nr:GTPase ObgE [Spirochaetales bacterium]MCR5443873.1 GTPase ObgE [Sphaerochaetaceae bacterium]MBQ3697646.1 GTPase ObgE [Spirochaetales bacterium]MBQ3728089.1 GTPase ObgE [Spirochaetales bacterium]MBQ3830767.1 GTPase ObgE [Spirochaetales bacterium]